VSAPKEDRLDPKSGYWRQSAKPLQSLVFVLPFLIAYEAGLRLLWTNSDFAHTTSTAPAHVVAFALMQRFFVMLGATGAMLPALAVVIVLLVWHIARHDAWRVGFGVALGMAVESLVLVGPLVAIGFFVANHLPLWSVDRGTAQLVLLSCGAGVYEEAVFRLGALTLLCLLLNDVLRIPAKWGISLSVLVSSALFAGYHYWGSELFAWRSMVFRTTAGIYFAILFLTRGFGITVGVHAFYDILIVAMRSENHGAT
jgi:hypothetical protein